MSELTPRSPQESAEWTMTLRYSEAGENEAALRAWQRSVGDAPAAGRRAVR